MLMVRARGPSEMHRCSYLVLVLLLTICAASPCAQILNETYRLVRPDFLPSNELDQFGESSDISTDGRTVLAVVHSFGAVVFHRNEEDAWEAYGLETSLPLEVKDPWRVALSGDGRTAVLGARFTFSPVGHLDHVRTGVAFVFRLDDDRWQEEAVLVGSDASSGDRFGTEVDVSEDGNVVIVGASYHNDDSLHRQQGGLTWGAAYVFVRDETGAWNELAELLGEHDAVLYGREVEISGDGNTLAISSFIFPPAPGEERVSIYERQSENTYDPDTTFSEDSSTISLSRDGSLLLLETHVYRRDVSTGEWAETAALGRNAELFTDRDAALANVFEPDDDRAGHVYQLLDGEWETVADLVVSDEQGNFHYYSPSAGKDWAVLSVHGHAVYLFNISHILVGLESSPSVETSVRLSAPRPNPFSNETHLILGLDRPEYVMAVLYDVLGRVVGRPLDGPTPEGETMVSVGGGSLAPGLYLLLVSGEGWRETRRLVRVGH